MRGHQEEKEWTPDRSTERTDDAVILRTWAAAAAKQSKDGVQPIHVSNRRRGASEFVGQPERCKRTVRRGKRRDIGKATKSSGSSVTAPHQAYHGPLIMRIRLLPISIASLERSRWIVIDWIQAAICLSGTWASFHSLIIIIFSCLALLLAEADPEKCQLLAAVIVQPASESVVRASNVYGGQTWDIAMALQTPYRPIQTLCSTAIDIGKGPTGKRGTRGDAARPAPSIRRKELA